MGGNGEQGSIDPEQGRIYASSASTNRRSLIEININTTVTDPLERLVDVVLGLLDPVAVGLEGLFTFEDWCVYMYMRGCGVCASLRFV